MQHAQENINAQMNQYLSEKYECCWETDDKGVTCGWFRLYDAVDILNVASIIAKLAGRVMAIAASATGDDTKQVEITYHFAIGVVNCTFSVVLAGDRREIPSITPLLKSADWHEREMQELYDIHVLNHPNPQRLFLDESLQNADKLMVPLSEAMNGSCTTLLWERIMQSRNREAEK